MIEGKLCFLHRIFQIGRAKRGNPLRLAATSRGLNVTADLLRKDLREDRFPGQTVIRKGASKKFDTGWGGNVPVADESDAFGLALTNQFLQIRHKRDSGWVTLTKNVCMSVMIYTRLVNLSMLAVLLWNHAH